MTIKDRLFIFLSVVLLMLFAAEIFSNLSGRQAPDSPREQALLEEESISGILSRLKEAGLEPKEAKYYRIIE